MYLITNGQYLFCGFCGFSVSQRLPEPRWAQFHDDCACVYLFKTRQAAQQTLTDMRDAGASAKIVSVAKLDI